MSAALARLRRHFDDDLLARVGGHYELTALGQVLLDRTATAYDVLERLFASQADFDPAKESREFRLMASDYAVAVFGTELARVVHQEAPGIRLRFTRTQPTVVDDTATLLSATDGLLMPHGVISDFPNTDLYDDRWVFLVADDHPDVGDRLTRQDLARLPWVTYQRTHDAPAVRQLGMLGIEPRVEVSVDSFQLLPLLVTGTRRIARPTSGCGRRPRGSAAGWPASRRRGAVRRRVSPREGRPTVDAIAPPGTEAVIDLSGNEPIGRGAGIHRHRMGRPTAVRPLRVEAHRTVTHTSPASAAATARGRVRRGTATSALSMSARRPSHSSAGPGRSGTGVASVTSSHAGSRARARRPGRTRPCPAARSSRGPR